MFVRLAERIVLLARLATRKDPGLLGLRQQVWVLRRQNPTPDRGGLQRDSADV